MRAMDIRAEIRLIETRLRRAGFPVAEMLRRADVDVAQWQRWKTGKQTPLVTTWQRIQAAADNLAPERRSA